MTDAVITTTKALLDGHVPEGALGSDVAFALRGYRSGLLDRYDLLETVARTYRRRGGALIGVSETGR
jgi:hypothetical protein